MTCFKKLAGASSTPKKLAVWKAGKRSFINPQGTCSEEGGQARVGWIDVADC